MIRTLLVTLLVLAAGTPAAAKTYRADRFDVRVEVLPGGSLRVTETIVFSFTDGTFKNVFRVIPTRRTDGVEFQQASMDGQVLPQGKDPGQVEVRRKNGLRIDWHFAPVSESRHTFELTYVARGVVFVQGDHEVLAWRALPGEHDYAIGSTSLQFVVPAAPSGEVELATRRVDGQTGVSVNDGLVMVQGTLIRRNGWLEPRMRFARGTLLDGVPQWQQRDARHQAMLPTWGAVAGGVLLVGLLLLAMLRKTYDAPPSVMPAEWNSLLPPDDLPPALAGALVANGSPQLEHAMGAVMSMAERGILQIREEERRWGQRNFSIVRTSSGAVSPYEQPLIDALFHKAKEPGQVSLARARTNIVHRWSAVKAGIVTELRQRGLYDDGRAAHRNRYNLLGVVLLGLAAVAVVVTALNIDRAGAWAMLIPLAVAILGISSFIFAATETPLSNDGVRAAEQWRGYQKHLRRPQDIEPRWGASAGAEAKILPFAIALGLAAAWSKFMKKKGSEPPPWFHAASRADGGRSFAVFVAYGGAGSHGGGAGGAGGGAAGGGASGAR